MVIHFTKKTLSLLSLFIISLTIGLVCSYFYDQSPETLININRFRTELSKKETEADKGLNLISDLVDSNSIDSLYGYKFNKEDLSFYLYDDSNLLFWSDNHLDIDELNPKAVDSTFFVQLPNAYCVAKTIVCDDLLAMAIIRIKNDYPYENDQLSNLFSVDLHCDKSVSLCIGSSTDEFAVFDQQSQYLFSLQAPQEPVHNKYWGWVGMVAFFISMLILLFIYVRFNLFLKTKKLSVSQFGTISLLVFTIIALSLYFNYPGLLYWNKLFTPFQYASNKFLSTLNHLTFVTLFFMSFSYLFHFQLKLPEKFNHALSIIFQLGFSIYFILLYFVVASLVFNSNVDINIIRFSEFSFVSIWFHLLMLIWGLGLSLLFVKTHRWLQATGKLRQSYIADFLFIILSSLFYFSMWPQQAQSFALSYLFVYIILLAAYFLQHKKLGKLSSALFVFGFSLFFISNSVYLKQQKTQEKYKILAQNIMINGNTENDTMADFLLEELDKQLSEDEILNEIMLHPDSILIASDYLKSTYLRGFWNKYDMRMNIVQSRSELDYQYKDFIDEAGLKLKDTHFYSFPASYNDISYLGIFPLSHSIADSMYYYIEFHQRKNFKSFSFPNLLINTQLDLHNKADIQTARYQNSELAFESYGLNLPPNNNWINRSEDGFYVMQQMGKTYYIYQTDPDNQVLITEKYSESTTLYFLYFVYTILIFYLIVWLLMRIHSLSHRKKDHRIGLTAKYQYSFIGLLIFSFIAIFYVSVNYIQNKYKDEQIVQLENKKNYIQNALQERYYWNELLTSENSYNLNFDLQELSIIYQTDIHVYDNNGVLLASSQPFIFNKSLISRQMSPKAYFSVFSTLNQNECIGDLKHLTGYTQFFNGDFLQLGFIAVPQFLSQEEIRSEIQDFLSVIIHIYLIIIILAIILSVVIGRQLSAPLKEIENKLKEMRFGHRNKKIDYAFNDEIGQLVMQYNRTVDELDRSAKLLAQSEREHAWKTMARQIAHEINNPLTPMKLTIQQLQRTKNAGDERFDDYFRKSTITLIEQIDNLSRIAVTFSNFARMPEANFVKVDIAAKLYSVFQLFANNHRLIAITYSGNEADIFVKADSEQLTQVFNNLLKNAIQSIPSGRRGQVQIRISNTVNKVMIEIIDNGTGIPDDLIDKLFTPNFTTKSTGMGLGLSIVKNIVEMSGGEISFRTESGVGTSFSLSFPLLPIDRIRTTLSANK